MDFDIPKDLQDYLSVLDDFIEAEIKPLENENDNIRFSTIDVKMPEPIGIAAACRAKNGKPCLAKQGDGRMQRVTTGTPFQKPMAGKMAQTLGWR